MNVIFLFGSLGADPKPINGDGAKFSMATTERYKNKSGEIVSETEWHDVLCFGHTAKFVLEFVKKGDKVLVEGQKKTRSYEQDNITKYICEIKAVKVEGSKRRDGDS